MGFADEGEGAFAARPAELAALGVALSDEAKNRKLVRLSEIGTFRYDGGAQKMFLDIPPERFQPSLVDARGQAVRTEPARAGHGAVLSYALAGTALQIDDERGGASAIDTSLTATFDGRVFSPSGLFRFGAITGTTLADQSPVVRLDTVWQHFNEANMTVTRVGDAISGPLAWTRPIRFGGVQYQRNFGLRPDLITNPLPVVTGTAAVPSTVDIFVDNIRTYSREVAAGPFSISNVPISKAQAMVSISAPVPVVEGHATVSLIEAITYDDEERRIVAASYGRPITDKVFGFATGSWDLTRNDGSVFVGFNVLLQDRQTASIGATATPNSRGMTAEYTGYRQDGPNYFGWRTSMTRGSNEREVAGMTYQGPIVRADAYASRTRQSTFVTAYVTGAIATIDGEVYVASQLDDGFAVVDIGHPGVEVQLDNRPIGKTDSRGRVFVPGLIGHNINQITFDPNVLPADVQPSEIKKHVVPMRGSGVVVDMKVKPAGSSALVEFVTPEGAHVPVGSPVRLAGVDGEFVVGFDGQAFFETLAPRNEATIELEAGSCKAEFPFTPEPGKQVFVEKVICR